jgi:primosomal protein N' (replication factor Y)
LTKAPKQLEILMNFVRLSGAFSGRTLREVAKKELLQAGDGSSSGSRSLTDRLTNRAQSEVLGSLVRKLILEPYVKEVSRLDAGDTANNVLPELTPPQQTAVAQIHEAFAAKDVVLLHGITSSGKTELYIQLIDEQIRQGKQVLYMLPEIALTTQIIGRLRSVFGKKVGVYHSKFPDAERVEVWNNIGKPNGSSSLTNHGYSIVLGVRSSIFLPFANPGLVIEDEQHENTDKHFDPAPRYHARDAAIVLASMHGAKTLLGTATPAIESYYTAREGKYGLVELTQRFAGMELPEVNIVDMPFFHWSLKSRLLRSFGIAHKLSASSLISSQHINLL